MIALIRLGNDATASEAKALGALFADGRLASLEELSLDDNELGEGAAHLAEALLRLPAAEKAALQLHTISACTSEITAAGAYWLAVAVASIPSVKLLKLDGNQVRACTCI